jgi:hypothetical protein
MHRRHALALTAASTLMSRSAHAADGPVLVELFTSQGCSSCPSADAAFAHLLARPEVLPLAFHVTYWDRLGWPDTLGDSRFDQRQRAYAKLLGSSGVYTPQMVIQGRVDVVGSEHDRVLAVVDRVHERAPATPITFDGDHALLPAHSLEHPAHLWLAAFDAHYTVPVTRGENAGRTLEHANAVRDFIELGSWDGVARAVVLPLEGLRSAGRTGLALVVQDDQTGGVIAVGVLGL